jgi:uncharacterized protein
MGADLGAGFRLKAAFDAKAEGEPMSTSATEAGAQPDGLSPCQACGACCDYSPDWPRFTLEDDAALALIPEAFVAANLSGMRCDGNRCSALSGKIGEMTACTIYAVRPDVCHACLPGDDACNMARVRHGMAELPGG